MLLEQIKKENDIKNIAKEDWDKLAAEIREFLIEKISVTGGHLGSNLGAVELTMALHLALNLPEDKIIWDVGHQSYTHKLLTGRREGFENLRKYGGLSGFPKRKESDCDAFDTGHSSTSISAGLGMVKARDIKGEKNTVVAVIGDGSLTGGMAYEAMNNASRLDTNYIIILNDNNMSISENVGGVSKYLNNIRTADKYLNLRDNIYYSLLKKKNGDAVVEFVRRVKSGFKHLVIPGMFFEDMGLTYLGPVDGHDVNAMVKVINEAKKCKKAVLVHVMTNKGKGYEPAERHPARFHGAEPFDIATGLPKNKKLKANYTDVFSTVMIKLGQRNENVVAITAAMPDGTGLKRFRNMYPDRFFDDMRENNIRALIFFPGAHRYVPSPLTIGRIMGEAAERKIPIFLDEYTGNGNTWNELYNFLEKFPNNTFIFRAATGKWGHDRQVRPLLEHYPNFYFGLGGYWVPEGICELAKLYGAERLLFSSNYPKYSMGTQMLQLKHSRLSDDEIALIAGKNLDRLLKGAQL